MLKTHKITIITINLNNIEGLKRTLASIAAQKKHLPDGVILEHILVDGESTDGSTSAIRSDLDTKVITTSPRGAYNAINVGLTTATGDIVGLLHAGDVYTTESTMALIVKTFTTDSTLDFTWGDVIIGHRYYSAKTFTSKVLTTGFAPPHPSLYMRRALLDTIGYYDEKYRNAADFDYFVRLFSDKTLVSAYIPKALVRMELGGRSQSLRSRLWINNYERLHSLRSHGFHSSPFRLLIHYKNIISGYLCSTKKLRASSDH